ncbi:MAG: nuclear transport factor 2 family protein [Betaproteobacteria bacterium]|nr:nuclear transport factor 2 family protein [Betaproteobacteria bacterium]
MNPDSLLAPVEAQLAAYNAQDVDAFVACFAEDVVIEDGAGTIISTGRAVMRENYARMFAAHPLNRAEIVHRIVQGRYIVDHERITGRTPEPYFAVAIYRVEEGLIHHVRFLR